MCVFRKNGNFHFKNWQKGKYFDYLVGNFNHFYWIFHPCEKVFNEIFFLNQLKIYQMNSLTHWSVLLRTVICRPHNKQTRSTRETKPICKSWFLSDAIINIDEYRFVPWNRAGIKMAELDFFFLFASSLPSKIMNGKRKSTKERIEKRTIFKLLRISIGGERE